MNTSATQELIRVIECRYQDFRLGGDVPTIHENSEKLAREMLNFKDHKAWKIYHRVKDTLLTPIF